MSAFVEQKTNAELNRRQFLKTAIVSGVALGAGSPALAGETKGEMPYRALGRTGE